MFTVILLAQSALAAESYPTAWDGDFNDIDEAASPSGQAYYNFADTCGGAPQSAYVDGLWYDFGPLLGFGDTRTRKLEITWSGTATSMGRADVNLLVEYSTDDGASWTALVDDTYTSGNHTGLGGTETVTLPLSVDLDEVQVFASLTVDEHCPGSVGSYGGTMQVQEIRVWR